MRSRTVFVSCLFIVITFVGAGKPAPEESPAARSKNYFQQQADVLIRQLKQLEKAVLDNKPSSILRSHFLASRISYKKLELFIAYYQSGDEPRFNGIANGFIEEEDPAAYQEPEGLQVVETYLFPAYNPAHKDSLLLFTEKLMRIASGAASNGNYLNPDQFLADAAMEELYRIATLGITGFDTPLSSNAIPETAAALESVRFVMQSYTGQAQPNTDAGLPAALQRADNAIRYCKNHPGFDSFNRMEFIRNYIDPLCEQWGRIITKLGLPENGSRYTLIKKRGSLFRPGSLRTDAYLGDDQFTRQRAVLGRKLFYEPRLSASGKRSCGSCHQPGKAFTDGLATALQTDEHSPLPRNTPTLWNAALQHNLFYDSRQNSMDRLITEVLSNEKEMNSGAQRAFEKISSDTAYRSLFESAYGNTASAFSPPNAVNAISMYLHTLISYNAPFDQYMRGNNKAIPEEAINGFNLFAGKAKCATCHYIPFFNGSKPPLWYYQESEVIGVPAAPFTTPAQPDTDPGRTAILPRSFFEHAFKTPTLRNIALTAPYMHNGVFKTLDEVIDFYDKGGGNGLDFALPNQTLPFVKLGLTQKEKMELKVFMLTLTDTSGFTGPTIH